ncbi:uncharacterized protein LOC132721468 [Ruditapes philippinarum]|uniref:uncharacterized protein LOC132721468 n=1 Tax=Ruditapes philippinarum TaxID=129788 RepID=UPI00295B2ADF|nr:uncharacterized protein LOC132721468 [Ruditapes philippinarum]
MIHNTFGKVIILLTIAVLWISRTADAKKPCLPAKNMISCLIDRCKLGMKCPGDPTATCKMVQTKCDGCKAMWFSKSGEKASCGLRKNLKLCPGGEPIVKCSLDLCKWPCTHPDFRGAECRKTVCGECGSEYFVKGKWVKCPIEQPTKKETKVNGHIGAGICNKVACSIAVCVGQRCSKVPRAVCRPNDCNTCTPEWFLDNRPVNCETGELIARKPLVSTPIKPWQKPCEKGIPLTKCDMKVCESKVCRNFPNAQCRPDGCGGCRDTWYIGDKLIDCYSDECPPKVPIVKCVDDPCKYFGHYCPAAECRASQCGKCEAKFFSNGQEIDCAMPPKECPMGVQPLQCPYYTCPANICPSNKRLMCRIDPCGRTCKYDFIDIYNGEPMLCRVFDGDGRHQDNAGQVTDQNVGDGGNSVNPPSLGDIVGSPDRLGLGLPQSIDSMSGQKQDNFVGDLKPSGVTFNTDASTGKSDGSFQVKPLFINPGPPITDPDLLTLLRSYPHEMANIPTAMIQIALKKDKGMPITSEAFIQESSPVTSQVIDNGNVIALKPKPQHPQKNMNTKPKDDKTVKTSQNVRDNVFSDQLFELPSHNSVLYPELSNLATESSKGPKKNDRSNNKGILPSINSAQKDNNKNNPFKHPGKTVKKVKPIKEKPAEKTSKKQGIKVSQPKSPIEGIPISIGMFTMWAMS